MKNTKTANMEMVKEEIKKSITKEQWLKCHAIIHGASAVNGAVGAGLAATNVADSVIMTTVQVPMVIALGTVLGKHITKTAAFSMTAAKLGKFVGTRVSKVLWGKIPVLGNAINAGTAVVTTESLGWLVVADFVSNVDTRVFEAAFSIRKS